MKVRSEVAPTQLESVLGRLREMVLRGRFPGQAKLEEKQLAEMLGVSRTPVRLALQSLAQERLLIYSPHRGFHVRAFTTDEVVNAIEVRGRLEAFACERLAARGIGDPAAATVRRNLEATRALLALPSHDAADVNSWVALNAEFHRILTAESGNALVGELIAQVENIPMASSALVPTTSDNVAEVFDYVGDALHMHELVFDAILRREPARAHNLMLEHVHQGRLRIMGIIERWQQEGAPDGLPVVRTVAPPAADAAAPARRRRRTRAALGAPATSGGSSGSPAPSGA